MKQEGGKREGGRENEGVREKEKGIQREKSVKIIFREKEQESFRSLVYCFSTWTSIVFC